MKKCDAQAVRQSGEKWGKVGKSGEKWVERLKRAPNCSAMLKHLHRRACCTRGSNPWQVLCGWGSTSRKDNRYWWMNKKLLKEKENLGSEWGDIWNSGTKLQSFPQTIYGAYWICGGGWRSYTCEQYQPTAALYLFIYSVWLADIGHNHITRVSVY